MRIPLVSAIGAALALFGWISEAVAADPCDLFPIALPAEWASNAIPGEILVDILNGTQPGNFGWLTWSGSPSESTLAKSLSAADSSTYTNPDDVQDHQVSIGDWIRAKPGVSNSKSVRDALDALERMDITVPTWDQVRGQGAEAVYRVGGFARVRLVSYQLPGQNRITARFLGNAMCPARNLPPSVEAGADLTNALHALPATLTLQGRVSDDGLPVSGSLSIMWMVLSGPGSVFFDQSNSAMTSATFSQEGTYVLQLTASDSELSANDQVVVTINRDNQPPVAYPTNIVIEEDVPALISLPAMDRDGDALEYLIVSQPGAGTLTGSGATYVYTPCADCTASDQFVFKVRDGFLESSNALVTITIVPVNDMPLADPVSVTNNEDTTFAVPLSGSDVEGSSLTFIVLTQPTNGTITTTSSNVVFYAPSNNFFGKDGFTYQVNDGGLNSAPAPVLVAVSPINDPPLVDAGPNQLISEPTNTVVLAGAVSDDEFPTALADLIEWSLVNGPGSVTFGDSNQPVTTATFSTSGVYTLQLAASDALLGATDTVVVVVNAKPIVTAGADFTNTLPATIALNGSASDDGLPQTGALTVLWEKVSGAGTVTFENPASTNTVVQFSASGIYTLRLKAFDSVASASDEINVTVNRAPIVDAGSDQTHSTFEVELLGTVADDNVPDGIGMASVWKKVSGPGEVFFDSAASPGTVATFSEPGTYVLRLEASDTFATASDDVLVRINALPQALAQTVILAEDAAAEILLYGQDADNEPLTYEFTSQPLHGLLTGTAPDVRYVPATNYFGPDSFVFQVSDGLATSAVATVSLIVQPVNDAPMVADVSVTTHEDTPIEISLTGNDVEGDALTFSVVTAPEHGTIQFNANRCIYTPAANFNGADAFTFKASDGAADSAPGAVNVLVVPVNDSPTVAITSPANGREFTNGEPIRIGIAASDVDGAVSLAVLRADGAELVSSPTAPFEFIWTNASIGFHTLTAIATDNDGAVSQSAAVTIGVAIPEGGDFTVDAGVDQLIASPAAASLGGQVVILLPNVSATTNASWSKVSGPGNVTFSNATSLATLASFTEPGEYVLKLSVTTTLGRHSDTLTVEVLPPARNGLVATRSNRGKDFWLTFLSNIPGDLYNYSGLSLIVGADQDTTGEATFFDAEYGSRRTVAFTVRAGSTTVVPIRKTGADATLDHSDVVQSNAIHVTALANVSIFAINYRKASTDGYLALPTAMLGTNYFVLTYGNSAHAANPLSFIGGTQFAIVASEDDTTVTITPTIPTGGRAASIPYEITLNRDETYRLLNFETFEGDFTGTTISSDRPVAVFSGHQADFVPAATWAADHLVEQLPPVNTWGRQFVTMPLATRFNGDTFRILASEDDTYVSLNGELLTHLNRGQFHERIIDRPASIIATKPILVAQFANGQYYDFTLGDPFMALVPAIDQFGGSHVLATPTVYQKLPGGFFDVYSNYVNLVVPAVAVGTVSVDGEPVSTERFVSIGTSGYVGAQLPVPPGTHRFTADAPFGVLLYGWADFESYASAGGIYSDTVEDGTTLALSQRTASALVGAEKVVIAKVTNARGAPVADVEVGFSVAGVNSRTNRLHTSLFGEAIFSYVGSTVGSDVITARLLDREQSVTNEWLAGGENQPPIVSAGGELLINFGESVILNAAVNDDGQPVGPLAIEWRTLGGPVAVRFSDLHAGSTTASFDLPGTYELELEANDSVFSSRDTIKVTVAPINILPVLQVDGPYFDHNYVGEWVSLSGGATDVDGSIVRVELYEGETRLQETTVNEFDDFYFEWQVSRLGTNEISVVAVDDRGGRTRSRVLPLVAHELRITLTQPAPMALVGTAKTIFAKLTDESGNPWGRHWVSFTVTGANPTAGLAYGYDGTAEATIVYSGRNPGVDVIEASVYGSPLTARLTNTWLLSSTNQPPFVSASVAGALVKNKPVTLIGSAADDGSPEGQLTYSWRVLNSRWPVRIENAFSNVATAYFTTAYGSYQVEFTASDGMFSSRRVLNVSISDNSPPVVHLTVSTNEAQVGETITLYGTVFDEEDPYATLVFLEDGWRLLDGPFYWSRDNPDQVFTTTYTVWWKGVINLSARASDARGLGASDQVQFFAGERPTVAWASPLAGQTITINQSVNLEVQANDNDGYVLGVTYYLRQGTNLVTLGQGTGPQFTRTWTPTVVGTVTLVARATDDDGLPSRDALLEVSVSAPPVGVAIVSPATNALLKVDQVTTIAVDLLDVAHSVTNLEFRVDDVVLTNGLFTTTAWTPDEFGLHTLQVFADDVYGRRTQSEAIEVIAIEVVPPEVFLVSPTNGTEFPSGASVPVLVEAEDGGTNLQMALWADGSVVAVTNTTNSSVQFALTNLSGWHVLMGQAVNETGGNGTSEEVHVFVARVESAVVPVPAGLVLRALSPTRIELTWPALPAGEAAGVIVERWIPERSVWLELNQAPVSGTSCTNDSLYPETLHRYRLAAVNAQGERSPYSNEAQITTPAVPQNYRVIDLTTAIGNTLEIQRPISNPLTNSSLHHYDQRLAHAVGGNYARAVLGTNANSIVAAAARFKERWPQIELDFDPVLVTPKSILPRAGFLTGADGSGVTVSDASANLFPIGDPYRAVKAFLHEHRALFGHGEDALTQAIVTRDYVAPGGVQTVAWQQQVGGVPVFNALLVAHITSAGELAALSSLFTPQPDQAADPAMLALFNANADLPVSVTDSLIAAVANIGEIFGPEDIAVKTQPDGVARRQTFTAARGIKGDAFAELTWFPSRRTQLRLCWQVIFTSRFHNEMFLTLVAADTGEIVYRRSLTATASEASYRVYAAGSPSPFLPGLSAPGTTQPPFVARELVTLSALDTNASPVGWIPEADNTTSGNNVDAALDRDDDDVPDARPLGIPARVFDFPLEVGTSPQNYGEAATVQLFYWNNWMHDTLHRFGFNEAAGNFQNNSFGRGGAGGDAVMAQAQDGLALNDRTHINNANMSTPPDGYAPRMQMYVFDGATPNRDGSLDAEIVLHEYTHGLSTRLIGAGAGIDAVATAGMGEGWSDFLALAMLAPSGADVDGTYPMGGYTAFHAFGTSFEENYYFGIRRYPYCTDTNKNPLTFRDIDPLQAQPHDGVPRSPLCGPFRASDASEVHRQGEVWCEMLWEVRAALIRKHGAVQGNSLAVQLVIDGLRFSPPNPNFVQARDAILLADRIWSGGENAVDLWTAFARRGLGFGAKAPDSRTTTGVRESFETLPALAAERVEILGGNGNGSVEANESNDIEVYIRNQGAGMASQVSAQLSTSTPGVTVVQPGSGYPDVPRGEARANLAMFQIQTTVGFLEGAPIDIMFVLNSGDASTTNYLRLFTGNPNPAILFDGYAALADATTASARLRDLAPIDLGSFEPLWMSDDSSCLLKSGGGYVLWHADGTIEQVNHPGFIAHRLTRRGIVVGQLASPNTVDEFGNQLGHTLGVRWERGAGLVPLTLTGYAYRFPKDAIVETKKGSAYASATGDFLDFVTEQPTLQDVWDLNAQNQAAGAASVYIRPFDIDADNAISGFEVKLGLGHLIRYDAAGVMNWETTTERGYSTAPGAATKYAVAYNALFTTAALFDIDSQWHWLGPLSFEPGNPATAIALLLNETGTAAGYGGVVSGNPEVDAMIPTHAFRWTAMRGEFGGNESFLRLDANPVLEDLGTLPDGLYSQPYAMNAKGDLVGYSDFDQVVNGSVRYNPYNFHGVYWDAAANAPQSLGSLGAVGLASRGYSYAFAINDREQIVGTSLRPQDGASAAVFWQRNHNTNGEPFWETNDLNLRVIGDSWFVLSAVGINNNGVILASGIRQDGQGGSQTRSLLLVPASLAVDVSRNREITIDQADATTPQRVFRFWINDDHDQGDVAERGDNVPGKYLFRSPNFEDREVNGRNDLIDFFPVFLNLHTLLQEFSPDEGYEFYLSQADGALNFVYTDLTRSRAFDYLTNSDEHAYGVQFNKAPYEADTIRVTPTGVRLSSDFLGRINHDPNKGVVLVEGRQKTREPLMLEIRHRGQTFQGIPMYIGIGGVESMYRWLNFRQAIEVEPWRARSIHIATRANTPENFPDAESNDRQFVYAHGYNVNETDSRAEIAEMFKRLWQSGSRAMFTGVSWFGSQGKIFDYFPSPDYHINVRNAFMTAGPLRDAVGELPGRQKWAAAHSLGNMLVSAAIVDHGMNVNGFFAIDAAVPMEAYDDSPLLQTELMIGASSPGQYPWIQYERRLWASEWYHLFSPANGFANDGRYRLTWRNRFAGIQNVYNFYSSGDQSGEEVLENSDGTLPRLPLPPNPTPTRWAWVSQEMRKGSWIFDLLSVKCQGGWAPNFNHFVSDNAGNVPRKRVLSPQEASSLTSDQLRVQPFFKPFLEDRLFDLQQGSAAAEEPKVHSEVLGAGVPALTNPAGSNPVQKLETGGNEHNINMSSDEIQTGWPLRRLSGHWERRWLHSDLKDVSYPFNHRLHERIVGIGGLNSEH